MRKRRYKNGANVQKPVPPSVSAGTPRTEDGWATYLSGIPSFAGELAAVGVVDGRVKDRDAQVPVLIDVRVPHFCEEADAGWRVRIIRREFHVRLKQKKDLH